MLRPDNRPRLISPSEMVPTKEFSLFTTRTILKPVSFRLAIESLIKELEFKIALCQKFSDIFKCSFPI